MTVRIGVIGCGTATSRIHLPAMRRSDRYEVVAFASRRLSSAQRACEEWGAGEVVEHWEALVQRPDLDAVLVATVNSQHRQVAVAAVEAGKHVLVEKPMATTVADADAMVAAARANGVVLAPTHNARFAKPFVAARQAMAAGRIGTVVSARCAFGHAGPQTWAPEATWFFDPALSGGGALMDLGVHAADLLRFVLGSEPEAVAAVVDEAGQGAVERWAQLLVRFSSGAAASLHASWVARPGPDHQLTVFGSEGTLHLDASTPLTLLPGAGGEPERVALDGAASNLYDGFADAVERGTAPPVTGEDGRAAVAVVAAGYDAAHSRREAPVVPPPAD